MHKTDTRTHGHQRGSRTDAGTAGTEDTERARTPTRAAGSRRGLQVSRDKDRGEALAPKTLGGWGGGEVGTGPQAQDPSPRTRGPGGDGCVWSDSSGTPGSWHCPFPGVCMCVWGGSAWDAGEGALVGTSSKMTGLSPAPQRPRRLDGSPRRQLPCGPAAGQLSRVSPSPLLPGLWMCMCACTRRHIHMSTHMCLLHTQARAYVGTHTHLHMCACTYMFAHMCLRVHTHASVYMRVSARTHLHLCACVRACLHVVCVCV